MFVVTAEASNNPWLLPLAGWTGLFAVVVIGLHWRAEYLREVKGERRRSAVVVGLIGLAFIIWGIVVAPPVLGHLNPLPAASPTQANKSLYTKLKFSCAVPEATTTDINYTLTVENDNPNSVTNKSARFGLSPTLDYSKMQEPSLGLCVAANSGTEDIMNVNLEMAYELRPLMDLNGADYAQGFKTDFVAVSIPIIHARGSAYVLFHNASRFTDLFLAPKNYCNLVTAESAPYSERCFLPGRVLFNEDIVSLPIELTPTWSNTGEQQ